MYGSWNAHTATRLLPSTAMDIVSTVPIPVTWQIGLEVADMNTEQLTKEKRYMLAMHFIREMFQEGLITKGEYAKAEWRIRGKYCPVISPLLVDIDLL